MNGWKYERNFAVSHNDTIKFHFKHETLRLLYVPYPVECISPI